MGQHQVVDHQPAIGPLWAFHPNAASKTPGFVQGFPTVTATAIGLVRRLRKAAFGGIVAAIVVQRHPLVVQDPTVDPSHIGCAKDLASGCIKGTSSTATTESPRKPETLADDANSPRLRTTSPLRVDALRSSRSLRWWFESNPRKTKKGLHLWTLPWRLQVCWTWVTVFPRVEIRLHGRIKTRCAEVRLQHCERSGRLLVNAKAVFMVESGPCCDTGWAGPPKRPERGNSARRSTCTEMRRGRAAPRAVLCFEHDGQVFCRPYLV